MQSNVNAAAFTNFLLFLILDLPKPACQNCPAVEEAPSMKKVLDAFCLHDFGKFQISESCDLLKKYTLWSMYTDKILFFLS